MIKMSINIDVETDADFIVCIIIHIVKLQIS